MDSYSIDQLTGPLSPLERVRAPEKLFANGDLDLLRISPRVAVIGSRAVTAEGRAMAVLVSDLLLERGAVLVSGLARGVDTIAHEMAISRRGRTVAVLGTPLDQFAPPENEDLQRRIAAEHLVVSQFPQGHKTTRKDFPIRNRTMALLSHMTIIADAAAKSGTRYQADEALRLGRGLFVPERLLNSVPWMLDLVRVGATVYNADTITALLEHQLPT